MAVAAWTSSTAFVVGDIRRATTEQASGLWFRCTTAGTSASSEPSWPTDIGSTITDNTCVWTAISSVFDDVSELAPSAIIELFELRLVAALHGTADVYRFHAGSNAGVTGNIIWNGNTYVRFPVEADGFEMSSAGTLPQPTLRIANTDSSITTLLLLVNQTTPGNDLTGATVKRIRTLKRYLDGESTADPNAKFPDEIWRISRKGSENRDFVGFELSSEFDLVGQKLPKRQIVANTCQWIYRSAECGYTGTDFFDVNDNAAVSLAQDVCGKRLSSCKLRFGENGELPFGSFPGAGLIR